MIEIQDFSSKYIEEATRLALKGYEEERSIVKELPKNNYYENLYVLQKNMVTNDLGCVAIDNNKLVGFITCYGPINNFFGNVKGVFSPIHGHGAIRENRDYIYSKLYQYAAEKWVKNGILSHAIALYAHDEHGIKSFFHNGFGLRCVDAINSLENLKLDIEDTKFHIEEIEIDNIEYLFELQNSLGLHMLESPIFFPKSTFTIEDFKKKSLKRKSRFFVAKDKGSAMGYLEITHSGENFTCDDQGTINICGAYISEKYRGTNVFRSLLGYMARKLLEEGYYRCGVDFESINPTAMRAWTKYFTPYTYSVVRRIDERILNGN